MIYMKKEDLFLIDRTIYTNKKISEEEERNTFYKRCIWNDSFPEFCKKASDYLKEANDIKLILLLIIYY